MIVYNVKSNAKGKGGKMCKVRQVNAGGVSGLHGGVWGDFSKALLQKRWVF